MKDGAVRGGHFCGDGNRSHLIEKCAIIVVLLQHGRRAVLQGYQQRKSATGRACRLCTTTQKS